WRKSTLPTATAPIGAQRTGQSPLGFMAAAERSDRLPSSRPCPKFVRRSVRAVGIAARRDHDGRAMKADAREVLRDTAIFENLDEAQIEKLAAIAVRMRYEARETVLTKGDPALQLYVIASGRLKAITDAGEGRQ